MDFEGTIKRHSFIPVLIEPMFGSMKLSTATGFTIQHGSQQVLISNWHVFSGRNPRTGQPIDQESGAVPDGFSLTVPSYEDFPGRVSWNTYHIPIVDPEVGIGWEQHANAGQDFDIGMLKITSPPEAKTHPIPFAEEETELTPTWDLPVSVAEDVFVLGYPKGLTSPSAQFPIWKRASIASEPHLQREPYFLIDTATREGMSGSIVMTFKQPGYISPNGRRLADGNAFTPLGVYSGRFGAEDELGAQLGLVWKWDKVKEMILNPTPGSFELR